MNEQNEDNINSDYAVNKLINHIPSINYNIQDTSNKIKVNNVYKYNKNLKSIISNNLDISHYYRKLDLNKIRSIIDDSFQIINTKIFQIIGEQYKNKLNTINHLIKFCHELIELIEKEKINIEDYFKATMFVENKKLINEVANKSNKQIKL